MTDIEDLMLPGALKPLPYERPAIADIKKLRVSSWKLQRFIKDLQLKHGHSAKKMASYVGLTPSAITHLRRDRGQGVRLDTIMKFILAYDLDTQIVWNLIEKEGIKND